jgi:predicted DNA-binding transcriptional regulator YafY
MAKKSRHLSAPAPKVVTPERAKRLHRLLRMLGHRAQTRTSLAKRLRLDTRGFYRDLEFLRSMGILIDLHGQRYSLGEKTNAALGKLPFPDPGLTLEEAMLLARGRTVAHRKVKALIQQIIR